ncbi:MAG: XRE family transcriptional regulator [Cyanobacteria bacterium P01_E01_bin.42]
MNEYTISSGNIFKDLGFPNAEEYLFKVKLASEIARVVRQKDLEPPEIAKLLEIELGKVKDLNNGQLDDFSQEQLLSYLVRLTQKAEEKSFKIKLADAIANIIRQKTSNTSEIESLLGITATQLENLKNGKLDRFSQENLLLYLIALGQNSKIAIAP